MPFFNRPNLTEEQKIAKAIDTMIDSENLIRRLVETDLHNSRVHDTIRRNAEYISSMLRKENIKNSESEYLPSLQEAVILGMNYVRPQQED